MNTTLIKILLIGDYAIFRSALRMLVETDKRLRVIGEATNMESAAAIIEENEPDMILVDLPELDRKETLADLNHSTIPILVLIGEHDIEVYKRCLKLGISGLIPKEDSAEVLFKAINKIHRGEIWFDRAIMGETIRQLVGEKQIMNDHPKAHVTNGLTEREKQVVELICKGMKNKDIAESLFITETTVRHHLTSVFNKLEITSRLELVVYAFKNGMVAPPKMNGHHANGHAQQLTSLPIV